MVHPSLFLNSDECAKIKPIRIERKRRVTVRALSSYKGENHVYDCRTGESRERI